MPETASSLRHKRHRPVIRLIPALILLACSNGGTGPASVTATGEFLVQPSTDCRYDIEGSTSAQYGLDGGRLALVQVGSSVTGNAVDFSTGGFAFSTPLNSGTVNGDSLTVRFAYYELTGRLRAPGYVGTMRKDLSPLADLLCTFTAVRQ